MNVCVESSLNRVLPIAGQNCRESPICSNKARELNKITIVSFRRLFQYGFRCIWPFTYFLTKQNITWKPFCQDVMLYLFYHFGENSIVPNNNNNNNEM